MGNPDYQQQVTVGVFDSGAGGITVLTELERILPSSNVVYYADTAYCPYGARSHEQIKERSQLAADFLISKGADVIVVACNTATAAAIDSLREKFSIPFVGMEPAIKPAALATQTKRIGVLATAGTFNGRLYQDTVRRYASGIEIVYRVGEGLVELVEQGQHLSGAARELLQKYINPMLSANVDHIVLGCTHYPFFIPLLNSIVGPSVEIVNPAPAVASQAKRIVGSLYNENCQDAAPVTHFYSTGSMDALKLLAGYRGSHHRQSVFHQG